MSAENTNQFSSRTGLISSGSIPFIPVSPVMQGVGIRSTQCQKSACRPVRIAGHPHQQASFDKTMCPMHCLSEPNRKCRDCPSDCSDPPLPTASLPSQPTSYPSFLRKIRSRGGSSPKNLVSLRTRPGWVRDGTESRNASNSLEGRLGRSARPGEVRSWVSSVRILSSSWRSRRKVRGHMGDRRSGSGQRSNIGTRASFSLKL